MKFLKTSKVCKGYLNVISYLWFAQIYSNYTSESLPRRWMWRSLSVVLVLSTLRCFFCIYKPWCTLSTPGPPLLHLPWDGIRKRTLSLGFLGKILRVLRLEVSTLVFCLSTRCYSWTNFIDWLFCINFWNHRGSMVFYKVFLLCLHE
jgi:hypothetical protein